MKNLFDIAGKVVVITGGTGVLGKGIAGQCSQHYLFHIHSLRREMTECGIDSLLGLTLTGSITCICHCVISSYFV